MTYDLLIQNATLLDPAEAGLAVLPTHDLAIAGGRIAAVLDGGATVVATTSRLDDDRLEFYKRLYRENARFGATLWVVPANMASYADIDALVSWGGEEQTESLGPQSVHVKDAQTPTLLFPFAAPRVAGDLSRPVRAPRWR